MSEWTICSRKKYPLSKFAYYNKRHDYLGWATLDLSKARTFETKKEALVWLDKKWLKYGDKVNEWKPIKTEKLISYWEKR